MARTKLDKIFDNKFHEIDYSHDNTTLDLQSDQFVEQSTNPYRAILVENIISEIDNIITNDFKEFKEVIDNKVKRVNKDDINNIYGAVRDKLLKEYRIIDIWFYLSNYFDIDTTRFFDSLTDKYKNELIKFLKVNTNLLEDDEINNIF
jgi:hypothetical protein